MAVPTVSARDVGFCPDRLERLTAVIERDVAAHRIPGAVVLIARFGAIAYFQEFGFLNPDTGSKMTKDAVFRVASLTKPVTSVAALMQVELGELLLDEPVAKYLPEFETTRAQGKSPLQHHAMPTIQDLFRHTAGFTYGEFGTSDIHKKYQQLDLLSGAQSSREMSAQLASLPLVYHPATVFEYGMSTDVLGHTVERLTGKSLDDVVTSQIAGPLGMRDTTFVLRAADHDRLAQPLRDGDAAQRPWMPVYGDSFEAPGWHSGGGGLLSTAYDYYVFMQALIDGGACGDRRLLSPKTVEWMTSNHLPPKLAFGEYMPALGMMAPMPERGQGFGLGFLVRTEVGRNAAPGSVGDFSWAGMTGTYAWADPVEGLVVVLMMQAPHERVRYRALMRQLVYQALVVRENEHSRGGRS